MALARNFIAAAALLLAFEGRALPGVITDIVNQVSHAYPILPFFMLILHWKPPQPLRQFHAHLALDNSPR